MKVVVLYFNNNILMVYSYILLWHKEFKMHQGFAEEKHKMIDVMGYSSENLITLCKCKVLLLFYILMQISGSVIGIYRSIFIYKYIKIYKIYFISFQGVKCLGNK